MGNMLNELYNLGMGLLKVISDAWDWLSSPLVIEINWIRIPLMIPNGISIDTGWTPLAFLGSGLLVLLGLWIIKAIAPLL